MNSAERELMQEIEDLHSRVFLICAGIDSIRQVAKNGKGSLATFAEMVNALVWIEKCATGLQARLKELDQ